MASKQYTDEFKAEAVKQVTERGFAVAEVAKRLGVSSHSLYQWLRKSRSRGISNSPQPIVQEAALQPEFVIQPMKHR